MGGQTAGGAILYSMAFGMTLDGITTGSAIVNARNSIFAGSLVAGGSNANNVRIKDGPGTPAQASIFNGLGPNIIETTLTPALNSDSAPGGIAPTQVTDALLDPGGLKNNGGPTQTIALVAVKRVNKTSTTMVFGKLVDVNTGQLSVGMTVAGPGIPASTTIVSIDSGAQITISANATQTSSSTLTYTLSGNPAIGKANASLAPATDQRGFARGIAPDLGAFQTVFTDNFTRANNSNLGINWWTTVLGTMGISGNKAAGLTTPGLPYVVDLAQVNGISLLNAADSAVVNVGTTGERYAGVFARRDAAGDMYVAMLGVNSAGNPAGTPTARAPLPLHPRSAGDTKRRLELPCLQGFAHATQHR